MRRPIDLLIATLGAGASLVGCSLLLTYTGASGAGDAGATLDAGLIGEAQAAEATVAEGGVAEAGLAEAGAVEAAAADAAYPPDSWCAMQDASLVLCDDFDDGILGGRWTATNFPFNGAATFSSVASSPPRSFEVSVPFFTQTPCATCTSETLSEVTPAAAHVSFAFDILPLAFPFEADGGGDGSFYTAGLTQGPGLPRSAIWLLVAPGFIQLDEQLFYGVDAGGAEIYNPTPLTQTLTPGAFTRVVLEADFEAQPPTVTVSVGPAGGPPPKTARTVTLTPGPWWGKAQNTALLGATWVTPGPAFAAVYDNATVSAY